uniref:Torsin family 3 member A n=1 Tax=Nothoprocta perdicaria TaxID=30464 RepID=A0A8C6ZLZ0_NOTPE
MAAPARSAPRPWGEEGRAGRSARPQRPPARQRPGSSCAPVPAGLESELNGQLHGQHLAGEVVLRAVRGFLQKPQPEKALVLSFHGWSGTGKNFVARMVASHLYRDGLRSECVRTFISLFHFPHAQYVDSYKKQISETTQLCQQSLFIFDEAEKLHFGLLDRELLAAPSSLLLGLRLSNIPCFCSSIGGNAINEVALDFRRARRPREEIPMDDEQGCSDLRAALCFPTDGGYARSHFLEENLIDFFVPFLPLERRHVRLCARDAFLARALPYTEAALDEVAKMMVFVPKEEKLFSAQGCKSVSQRINYFLP